MIHTVWHTYRLCVDGYIKANLNIYPHSGKKRYSLSSSNKHSYSSINYRQFSKSGLKLYERLSIIDKAMYGI